MIIVLKPLSPKEDIERVENMVKARGLDTHVIEGAEMTIIGCIGDTSRIDPRLFEVNPYVDKVMHVQEPYKLANRAFHPDNSVVDVSGVKIGDGHLGLIAGPCSVESEEQVVAIAKAVKAVNDSKTAKEKADAEARAKAEQEAAAQAAAAQQAQQSQQRSYPSSGSGSNRSYSSGGWSAGSGGSGSTGGQSYSGSSSSGSSTPSNGSDDYDITQDPFFNQHTTNSSCASGGFCPIG